MSSLSFVREGVRFHRRGWLLSQGIRSNSYAEVCGVKLRQCIISYLRFKSRSMRSKENIQTQLQFREGSSTDFTHATGKFRIRIAHLLARTQYTSPLYVALVSATSQSWAVAFLGWAGKKSTLRIHGLTCKIYEW